ncbi:alpha/beta fold hydrolase [Thalassotalea fusca]
MTKLSNSITEYAVKPYRIDLGGYTISGIESGNSNAPTLVCLHGWLDNAASFLPLVPWLSDFHVIAIDWPGHGLSDHRSHDAHYHFLDYVYDLLQLWQVNQWSEVHIVGHSMGGMIATAFASAFPEKVASLTLIDALGFISSDEKQATAQLRKGLLSRLKVNEKSTSSPIELASAVQARVQVSDLSYEHAKLIIERGLKPVENGYVWRSDKRLRTISPYRLSPLQADQIFDDLAKPTQLLYGNKGMSFVSEAIARYRSKNELVAIHELQGGHHVHMEQPQKCAELIQTFINGK